MQYAVAAFLIITAILAVISLCRASRRAQDAGWEQLAKLMEEGKKK